MKKVFSFIFLIIFLFISGPVFAEQTEKEESKPLALSQEQMFVREKKLAQKMGARFNRRTIVLRYDSTPVKIGNVSVPRHLFFDDDLFSEEEREMLRKLGHLK